MLGPDGPIPAAHLLPKPINVRPAVVGDATVGKTASKVVEQFARYKEILGISKTLLVTTDDIRVPGDQVNLILNNVRVELADFDRISREIKSFLEGSGP